MSSLKTMTIDVSGWSNEKVCEFLDWLEMFEDHQPGKTYIETCYSLKEEFATGSADLDTSETLEELKETQQDLLQIKETLEDIKASAPTDEVLSVLVKVLVQQYHSQFSRFLRRFIQETIVELSENYPGEGNQMGMALTKELNEIKSGRDLQNPDDELMTNLLTCLCRFRHQRNLPYLSEADQGLLTEQIKEAA